jgi:hypothetical protein
LQNNGQKDSRVRIKEQLNNGQKDRRITDRRTQEQCTERHQNDGQKDSGILTRRAAE